ncbi:uncharacterized protein LOC127262702 [Andrographis paniculata]|uniref:uncharacterized protein LOC127262702 n=1 Tax=Andrographis paniculata TaxID=175694 RepID=UPI0021E786B7|nr:uncharacterized protein LOC127262702 [Andrographis paniculata]
MARPYSEPATLKHTRKNPSIFKSHFYLFTLSILIVFFFFMSQLWPQILTTTTTTPESFFLHSHHNSSCTNTSIATMLQESITFLPLKDLRYSNNPLHGHTWFMSSLFDTRENGHVQFQEFPSKASKGRILCLNGSDTHDGSRNSYALAWPQFLPPNSTLLNGLTFISYNHYNYHNIWHALSAAVPFVAWHLHHRCRNPNSPARWILYHWGELRTSMAPWLTSLMEATFETPVKIETFDASINGGFNFPACFERAVVMRHNEGGMSRERRMQVYDFLRCKARVFCNVQIIGKPIEVNDHGIPVIRVTMLMRTGPRSFRNDSAVIGIFEDACRKVAGCRLRVAHANNLSFCQQVELMSSTDVVVSPHGAQLTNIFLMDRNSSVMEFFPKGWLRLAGIGQYVYHWIASWSGMNHRGAWRDPGGGDDSDVCNLPENDRRCMTVYKNAKIGHNRSYFLKWAGDVLNDVSIGKAANIGFGNGISEGNKISSCDCN